MLYRVPRLLAVGKPGGRGRLQLHLGPYPPSIEVTVASLVIRLRVSVLCQLDTRQEQPSSRDGGRLYTTVPGMAR